MARIHKLTKNGQAICPATRMDAVVHPDLKVAASELIGEVNVSKIYPTGGTGGTDKYTLEAAVAKIPESLRSVGIKCSFTGEGGLPQTWVYMGGTFTDVGSWVEAGAADEEGTDARISARLVGFQRIAAKERYDSNFKDYYIRTDGTYWNRQSIVDDKAYLVKLDVSAFGGGTVEYFSAWHGSDSFLTLAFYKQDFSGTPTAEMFISGIVSLSSENKNIQATIPEDAVVAVFCLKYDRLSEDNVILRVADGKGSAFDEKAGPLRAGIENNLKYSANNSQGTFTERAGYEYGRIEPDGSIKWGLINGQKRMVGAEVAVPPNFIGGKVRYYNCNLNDDTLNAIVFYDDAGGVLEKIDNVAASKRSWTYAKIPSGAASLRHSIHENDMTDDSYYNLYFTASENADTIHTNAVRISRRSEHCGMLPLGVKDNYLVDANIVSYTGGIGVPSPFQRDGETMYGIRIVTKLQIHNVEDVIGQTCVLKIRKSGNAGRTFSVQESSGGEVFFNQDTQPGRLKRVNQDYCLAEILRNDDEHIWVYFTTAYTGQSLTLRSYADKDKSGYEELEIDRDRSFIFYGEYAPEELDIDRRYYTRAEKLGSQIAGKTAIVFADSLSYFTNSLMYDWGLSVFTISVGGARMSWNPGKDDTWLCSKKFIDGFRENGISKVDYAIFAVGTNDPKMEAASEENVKFVINNKRWFDSDASDDPFDSLGDDDKARFTSASCIYAAMLSLARLYKGVCFALVPPYRTPGASTGSAWDVDSYASALFNGRFRTAWATMREIAEVSGAVFIENWTRDSVASANAYHETDGTHPPYIIAQDEASNIGHALSRYYDPIAETVIG